MSRRRILIVSLSTLTLAISEPAKAAPAPQGGDVEVLPGPPQQLPNEPSTPLESRARTPRVEMAPASDRPQDSFMRHEETPDHRFLHGFRLGYAYTMDFDKPVKSLGDESLAQRTGMRSPHSFLIGYEAFYRMVGHSWLNVILVGNVIIAGLEQSQFYPTGNTLLGFEFNNSFQLGVGANLAPLKGAFAHTIFAAGWTPKVGSFYTPVHAFFIPDVDGVHRIGMTTGVTW